MDSAFEPALPPVVETTAFAAEAVEVSAPVRPAAPIDLRSWVAAVWLAGAVAAGVWLIVSHAAFLRWCRLRRTTASAEWLDDLAKDVLTDAVMCWPLLKPGGVIAFDDYEWEGHRHPHDRPQAGIDAFESVFRPQLALLRTGWRRMWKKCQ